MDLSLTKCIISNFSFVFTRFLVPKNDSGVGYCGATIMKLYFDTLNEDLKTNVTEGAVFYQGTPPPGSKCKKSKFTKSLIGAVTLAQTGKEVVKSLKLDNHEKYTGHCFR